jgi:hypothetical protein
MMQANVATQLRTVLKARRQARRFRSRVIGLAILGAVLFAAFGSLGAAEARVPADDPRTTYVASYCGRLQDFWDQLNAQYRQLKQQNPSDPALAGIKSDMEAIEYRWNQGCREVYGNIWFINPAVLDAVAGTTATLSSDPGGSNGGGNGTVIHDVTRLKSGNLVAR